MCINNLARFNFNCLYIVYLLENPYLTILNEIVIPWKKESGNGIKTETRNIRENEHKKACAMMERIYATIQLKNMSANRM